MKTIKQVGVILLFVLFSCYNQTNTETRENSQAGTERIDINGNWVIETATVFPITIPSNCDSVIAGDILIFDSLEQLYVLRQQDTCGFYTYHFDTVSRQIQVIEYDMIFYFNSVTVNTNKLSFISNHTKFPEHTTEQHMTILEKGNKINLIRKN